MFEVTLLLHTGTHTTLVDNNFRPVRVRASNISRKGDRLCDDHVRCASGIRSLTRTGAIPVRVFGCFLPKARWRDCLSLVKAMGSGTMFPAVDHVSVSAGQSSNDINQ